MKNDKKYTFEQKINKSLLYSAIIPMVMIFVVFIILSSVSSLIFIKYKTNKCIESIDSGLNNVVNCYRELIDNLDSTIYSYNTKLSLTKAGIINKQVYQAQIDSGITSQLYILDNDYNIINTDNSDILIYSWNKLINHLSEEKEGNFQFIDCIGNTKSMYIGKKTDSGYILININCDNLLPILTNDLSSNIISDPDGWVLVSNSKRYLNSIGKVNLKSSNKLSTYNHSYIYIANNYSEHLGVYIYSVVDFTYYLSIVVTVIFTTLFISIIVYIFNSIVIRKNIRKTVTEISDLENAFDKVAKGDFDTTIHYDSTIEMEKISNDFAVMIGGLKDLIEKNKTLAEVVYSIKTDYLINQFKTHFLFNTLDNIRFMCKIQPDMAEQMILSLSDLLRYYTDTTNDKVTIKEDFDYVDKYLKIVKCRFGDELKYTMDIEQGAENYVIPKLLIQSVVENAIKYGRDENGFVDISIRVFYKNGNMILLCKDHGKGIPSKILARLRSFFMLECNKTTHLGLYNINRRIKMEYGTQYGVFLKNNKGLEVKIVLPGKKENINEI